jgi:hypothetical protein
VLSGGNERFKNVDFIGLGDTTRIRLNLRGNSPFNS